MNYDLGNVPPWGTLWWDHIYGGDIFVQNIIWNVNMSAPYKTYSGVWIETLIENSCIFKIYDLCSPVECVNLISKENPYFSH